MHSVHGFTLLELVITLVIVAILVTVAIPSYEFATARARAASAKGCILEYAQLLERYRTIHMSYPDEPSDPECASDFPAHYVIGFAEGPSPEGFRIRAQPIGRQAEIENRCGTMTVNNIGQRTALTEECW